MAGVGRKGGHERRRKKGDGEGGEESGGRAEGYPTPNENPRYGRASQ